MSDNLRLFIAIELPEQHKSLLSEARREIKGVKWTPPDQLHLTLRFLGNVESSHVSTLVDRLQQIRSLSFTLHLEGISAFPSHRRPRIIHIATRDSKPLLTLHREVDEMVIAAGVLPDPKPFSPHVTIARVKEERRGELAAYFDQYRNLALPPMPVEEVRLYKSILQRTGALHECLYAFPLGT